VSSGEARCPKTESLPRTISRTVGLASTAALAVPFAERASKISRRQDPKLKRLVEKGLKPILKRARQESANDDDFRLKLDLVVNGVEILLGNGDGTFQPAANGYGSLGAPESIAIGDFKGDGRLDIATSTGLVALQAATVSLSASHLEFGGQKVGTTNATQSIILTNTGYVPLIIGSISSVLYFSESNTCPSSLPPGATCTITAAFRRTRHLVQPYFMRNPFRTAPDGRHWYRRDAVYGNWIYLR
jgi:hypothetical protein